MAKKNNIRSIRFSDELAELIDRQTGDTFTEKFENLITKCVWELPQKEQQIETFDEIITEKRKELAVLRNKTSGLQKQLYIIISKLNALEMAIDETANELKQ